MNLPSSQSNALSALTQRFIKGKVDAESFGHLEHVHVAYDLLTAYDFLEVLVIYAREIRRLATNAGVPEKFNLTVTLAYLSLIAERMTQLECQDFDDFLSRNPDLMSKEVLQSWYSQARLDSQLARDQFLLPDAGCRG